MENESFNFPDDLISKLGGDADLEKQNTEQIASNQNMMNLNQRNVDASLKYQM